MKGPKRHRGLSGTVLIMILTVMVVLIIMLMATLSVVTTANQRIYTKFEENQAYYTARSALDVYTSYLLNDENNLVLSGESFKYTKDDGTPGTADMFQGTKLQLDLYKIRSQCLTDIVDGATKYSGVSTLNKAENVVKGDNTFKTVPEEDNYALYHAANEQFDYIEYELKLPVISGGGNEYGKLVDVDLNDEDGDGNKDEQIAKIKVEILDRIYNTEPNYDNETIARVMSGHGQADDPSEQDIKDAIEKGSRSKDQMRIKVTATVKLMGTEGVAVVILNNMAKETPPSDNALTTTGGFAGGGGAQVRTAGGIASMETGTSDIGDGNYMSGSMFSLGKIKWVSSAATTLNKNEMIVAMGGVASSGNPTNVKSTGTGTCMFLGGESILSPAGGSQAVIGDDTYPVPIIAENIVAEQLNIHGDVYATAMHYAGGNDKKWSFNKSNVYVTDLYLDADTVNNVLDIQIDDEGGTHLKGINFSNLYNTSSGKLIFSKNAKFHFKYNGVDYVFDPATKTDPIDLTSTVTVTGADYNASIEPFDINKYDIVTKGGKLYRNYKNLPISIGGLNEIDIPTAQAYFGEYFREDAFHESTGELKDFNNQGISDPTDPVNEYGNIYSTANKNKWLKTGVDMLAEYAGLSAKADGSSYTINEIISGELISGLEPMPITSTEIDVSGGDKYFYLESGRTYYGCTWTVKGTGGRCVILVPEVGTTSIIEENEWGKYVNSGVSKSATFDNCMIITDEITDSTSEITNGTTKAPRVDIYGGTGSTLWTGNNNLICGYIIMPTGYVYMNNGKNSVTYDNGNGASMSVANVGIVGSILCSEFGESNQTGIIYLDKNSGADTPGKPFLNATPNLYVRN